MSLIESGVTVIQPQNNCKKFLKSGATCDTVSQRVQQILKKCFPFFNSGVTGDTASQILAQNPTSLV